MEGLGLDEPQRRTMGGFQATPLNGVGLTGPHHSFPGPHWPFWLCFPCQRLFRPNPLRRRMLSLQPPRSACHSHLSCLEKSARTLSVLEVVMKMTLNPYSEPNGNNKNNEDTVRVLASHQGHAAPDTLVYCLQPLCEVTKGELWGSCLPFSE